MERREIPARERLGRGGSSSRGGWPCCCGAHTAGGAALRGAALGFWGSACASWPRVSPLLPPVMWDASHQNTKSPLGDCKNIPVVKMNVVI